MAIRSLAIFIRAVFVIWGDENQTGIVHKDYYLLSENEVEQQQLFHEFYKEKYLNLDDDYYI